MTTGTEGAGRRSHADFAGLWRDVEDRASYWENLSRQQFTSSVRAQMRAQGLTQAELAGRLGWKPAQVSRALQGGQNLTLRSMVRICRALGLRLEVCAVAEGAPFAGAESNSGSAWPLLGADDEAPLVVAEAAETLLALHGGRRGVARTRGANRNRHRAKR